MKEKQLLLKISSIDMPDSVHQAIPTNIKLYINDKYVQEKADVIEVFTRNAIYSINPKIYFDSSGQFRKAIEYNGEKVIQFRIRPNGRPGSTTSVSAVFYKTKII